MTTNTQQAIRVEHVPIGDLRPDPANPRRISEAELEALTRSIREFGLVDPIIARHDDKIVIGGHQRLLAARRLGLETVPVVFVDLSEEQARLLNLALNRISGDWDQELLARLLSELEAAPNVDLSLSGFGDDEISKLLKSLAAREKRDRPESSTWTPPGRRHRPHQGPHGAICGAWAIIASCVAMRPTRATCRACWTAGRLGWAFTDPPYNVAYGDHGDQQRGARKRRIKNDALSPEAWEAFCRGWGKNLLDSVDGALYVCMAVNEELPTLFRVLKEAGAHWANMIVWAKDRFLLGRGNYHWQYEPIWYGWPDGERRQWHGGRDQSNVWQIPRPSASDLHPTMELVERAIENSSRPGDVVLDLFLGSGTTLIAAERTGRVCCGLEIDPHYCRIVIARWEAFTGQKAEKVETQ